MNFNPSALLDKFNLKKTSARISILNHLKKQTSPSTAEEIYKSLKQFDLATIYRTLNTFVDMQITKEIDFKEGKIRYELAHHHHHHLVCQKCHQVIPIFNCNLTKIEYLIAQKNNFSINYHSLEFFGLCQKCK